jgi:hypothetical protein
MYIYPILVLVLSNIVLLILASRSAVFVMQIPLIIRTLLVMSLVA